MRPTAAAMLQQNNNNNRPCLSMSASTQQLLHQCSTASLPLPTRLELSLGGLPLIRGLRAWALCSKNRRRAAGKATITTNQCPRPADVELSGECWGLGMDARQARIGALVTVATLKAADGGGKTQTQCLFLRSEKGSCLYSTTKPCTAAKGFLRGKSGTRDNGTAPPLNTDGNWVRVRSGRRWRKSGNASGREKSGVIRARHPNELGHVRATQLEQQQEVRNDASPERHRLAESQEERCTGEQPPLEASLGRAIPQEAMAAMKPNRSEDTEPDSSRSISENMESSPSDPIPTERRDTGNQIRDAATDDEICNCEEAEKETSEHSEFTPTQIEEQRADGSLKNSCPTETLKEDESTVSPNEHQDSLSGGPEERLTDRGGDSRTCSFPEEPGVVQEEETRIEEPQDEEKETLQNQDEPEREDSDVPTSDSGSSESPVTAFPTLPLSSAAAGNVGGGKRSEQEEEEEEEFGVFMQAEGGRDWNQELRIPVHYGSNESAELQSPALGDSSLHWTSDWRDQSDDSWTAFSQDTSERGGAIDQWWPTSVAEQRRGSQSTNQDSVAVFAQAFPWSSPPSQDASCSLRSVPTLRQLLGGGATQDEGLLDDFHDLNKMMDRRLKGANGASRDLLLRTLRLQPPESKNRPTVCRRPSPSLLSANQLAHSVASQRRLSYDSTRNTTQ